MVEGVNYSLERGQPVVTAMWLQDKLKTESEEGDMVDRAAIIRELTSVGKFLGSDQLSAAPGLAWGGHPVPPTMLAPHFGDPGGAAAFGSMGAFGGASAPGSFGGLGGSQAWGGGAPFQHGGRSRGRGGKPGKPARCGKCRNAGKSGSAIAHSFRNCPLTMCYKCNQRGHIERDCQT